MACDLLVGDASLLSRRDGLDVAVHGAARVLEGGRLPCRPARSHLGVGDLDLGRGVGAVGRRGEVRLRQGVAGGQHIT